MDLRVSVKIGLDPDDPVVAELRAAFATLTTQGAHTMTSMDNILAEVTRAQTIEASMETLLQQLVNLANDPPRLAEAVRALAANNDRATAAIIANTPQAAAA